MRLTTNTKQLAAALSKAAPLAARRNTLPALCCFHLHATEDGKLTVSTSNGDATMAVTLPADVKTPGTVLLSVDALPKLIKALDADDVELSHKSPHLVVEAGRSKYKLNCTDASDWPMRPLIVPTDALEIAPRAIWDLLDGTAYAVSGDESWTSLTGIHLSSQDDNVRADATDGHRLATHRRSIPFAKTLTTGAGIIVPRAMVDRLLAMLDTDTPAMWHTDGSLLTVGVGDTVIASRLIDGKFPEVDQVMPKTTDETASVQVGSAALVGALGRVARVLRGEIAGCKIVAKSGKLEISASSPDAGDAVEDVDCEASRDVKVKVNPAYLLDAIKHTVEDGAAVILEVNHGESPMVVHAIESGGRYAVVMPMRM
jgi:DNA polymerase-3 subunit beta